MKNFVKVSVREVVDKEAYIKEATIEVKGGFIVINLVKGLLSIEDTKEFLLRQLRLQSKFRDLEKAIPDGPDKISYSFEIGKKTEDDRIEEAWICLDTDFYDVEELEELEPEDLPDGVWPGL